MSADLRNSTRENFVISSLSFCARMSPGRRA
jgi:hypothetical protein